MWTMRRAARLACGSSGRSRALATSSKVPRQEYPTSFISHLKTQKVNVFNIGMAFLALSLSSQLVTYKQKTEKAEAASAALATRIGVLEEVIVSLGGEVPPTQEEAEAAAAAAAEAAAKADMERVKRAREDEARALVAGSSDGDSQDKKKKALLI